uniref:Matrix metallopeptidase 20b (enamelysin) n=1 Tax=Kryptolebias marmoratus TaxID=37003 RepID=A0A3Q3EPP5_KRYMA
FIALVLVLLLFLHYCYCCSLLFIRSFSLKKKSSLFLRSGLSFASKVKDMQTFFGLNATGALDSDTLEVMRSPRCGVPDVEDYSHTQGTRWNKNVLTYRYTRDLPRSAVDSLIQSAFNVWARASGLTFVRLRTNSADIMVEFATNAHGDFYPFDGPRGTLAHAFGPGLGAGGDTHFDDDERWTAGEKTGFNLFVVAAHEFGHALGLKHSRNPASVMYPTYKMSRPSNLLSREDVANINALYSKPFLSDRCAPDLTFDAVTTLGRATFFFRDRYLWIKHNEQSDIKEGPISNFMPKIKTSIDAAFWIPRRSAAYLIHGGTLENLLQSEDEHDAATLSVGFFPRLSPPAHRLSSVPSPQTLCQSWHDSAMTLWHDFL